MYSAGIYDEQVKKAEAMAIQAAEHGLPARLADLQQIGEARKAVQDNKDSFDFYTFAVAYGNIRSLFRMPFFLYVISVVVGVGFVCTLLHNYQLDYFTSQIEQRLKEADAANNQLIAASVRITQDIPPANQGTAEYSFRLFHPGAAESNRDADTSAAKGVPDIAFVLDLLTVCNLTDRQPEVKQTDAGVAYSTGMFEGNYRRSVTEAAFRLSFAMSDLLNETVKLNLIEHAFPIILDRKHTEEVAEKSEGHPLAVFSPYIGIDRIVNMPGDPIDIRSVVICKLKIYPRIRSYAQNVLSNRLSFFASISLYLLPIATAMLGCCIHLIYFYRRSLMTRPAADVLYAGEQIIASMLLGFCISVITPLFRDQHTSLTVFAFACGLLTENFGLMLMSVMPNFLQARAAPPRPRAPLQPAE